MGLLRLLSGSAVVVALAGCGNPDFRQSDAIRITSPSDLEVVSATPTGAGGSDEPFTLEWQAGDGPRPAGYAVFVGRPPIRPGQRLRALADDDDLCEKTPGCPDMDWFNTRHIYLTSDTSIEIPLLPLSSTDGLLSDDARETHRITVVGVDKLDRGGRRLGEAFDAVTVRGAK